MKTMDIVALIKEKGYSNKIYPNDFPTTSEVSCSMINIGSASRRRGAVYDLSFTVVSRGEHPSQSEKENAEIRALLNNSTDIVIGESQIISIMANSPIPVYSGQDESKNYYHTSVFAVLISD